MERQDGKVGIALQFMVKTGKNIEIRELQGLSSEMFLASSVFIYFNIMDYSTVVS